MATLIARGKATISGIVGTLDAALLYHEPQTASVSHEWDEEVVADSLGFNQAWIGRNERYMANFKFKILADTVAHADGVSLIAAYAKVTFSGFDMADFNGDYRNESGEQIDLNNASAAELSSKLLRYADSTQNTNSTTTPT